MINIGTTIFDWNAWTAIGTVLMAVATFVVVLQGWWNRKDDSQRHQDSFKPICILTPYDAIDPRHRRDTLLAIPDQPSASQGFGIVEIRCALRNIGFGPALNVGIMFRFLDMDGYLTPAWELAPLRVGESRGDDVQPLRIPIQFGQRFNQTDFSQIVGKLWEIIVVYEDIFGNHFYSVHQKRPLQLDKLHRASSCSELIAPSQAWVTFGRGTFPL